MAALAKQIGALETELAGNPSAFSRHGLLIDLLLKGNSKSRALTILELWNSYYKTNSVSEQQKYEMACGFIGFWKFDKYLRKDTIRINLTPERKEYLQQADRLLSSITNFSDPSLQNTILIKLAYVKECLGFNQPALVILSDLVKRQADDGVELAYAIFKAAGIIIDLKKTI
jgi:hypothetical protein